MQCPNALVASANTSLECSQNSRIALKDPAHVAEAIRECEKELQQSTTAKGLTQEMENGLISGDHPESDSGSDGGGDLSCDVGTQLIDGLLDDLGISGIVGDTISDMGAFLPISSSFNLKASLHRMLHSGIMATYASAGAMAKPVSCHSSLTCYGCASRSHANVALLSRV